MDNDNIGKTLRNRKPEVPEPKRYNIKELSEIVLDSYTKCDGGNKPDAAATGAVDYFTSFGLCIESMRNLYDAAQYLTHGEAALKDPDYSLEPNKYVLFLEDNIFSVKHFGEWTRYSNTKNAEDTSDKLMSELALCVNDRGRASAIFGDLQEALINITYALAHDKNYAGMKHFLDHANKLSTDFGSIIDEGVMLDIACMADYNIMVTEKKKMPLGKAGRFIKEFYKKYPDIPNYNGN